MSDSNQSNDEPLASGPSRRDVLRAGVAVSAPLGLAGCSFFGGGSTESPTDAPTDSPTPTEVATDAPTDSATPSETETPTESPTPTPYRTPSVSQDCLDLDPDAIEIEEFDSDRYQVVEGDSDLLVFDDFENAKDARDIIQGYGFTHHCFVGRPNPPMTYWLVGRSPPRTRDANPVESEDCTALDPTNVEVEEFESDQYRLVDGDLELLVFDELTNANRARDLVRHYGFTQICYVGRPDPPMTYWLTGE